jgi:hypothetical protein
MENNVELTYDIATGTLTDSTGKPVDPDTLAPKAQEPVVSDIRTKRLLRVALDPYYR